MAIGGGGVHSKAVKFEDGHLIWSGIPGNKPRDIVHSDLSHAADFLVANPGTTIQVELLGNNVLELGRLVRERYEQQ